MEPPLCTGVSVGWVASLKDGNAFQGSRAFVETKIGGSGKERGGRN